MSNHLTPAGSSPVPHTPVQVAVIGCGNLARLQHLPNIASSRRMTLHTCCDLDESLLRECEAKYRPRRTTTDFRAAVCDPDVDMICLATTEKLRLPVIQAAAEAGKPIYVEKPLAASLDEMLRIAKVVRQSGIAFCVGHNRRCSPAMVEARGWFRRHMTHPRPCPWRWEREKDARPRLAEEGVASMAVRINDDFYSWKAWVFDKTFAPHGALLFEMTHFTDLCNWFLDAKPREVFAMTTGELNHAVVVRYDTGELATITYCANGTHGYPKELYEVMGQGAIVAVDHMLEVRTSGIEDAPAVKKYAMLNDRHPHIGTQGGFEGWMEKKRAACQEAAAQHDPIRQFTAEPDKGHARCLERFVDQIQGQATECCGLEDAIMATRVAFAAVRSTIERRIVAVEECGVS